MQTAVQSAAYTLRAGSGTLKRTLANTDAHEPRRCQIGLRCCGAAARAAAQRRVRLKRPAVPHAPDARRRLRN